MSKDINLDWIEKSGGFEWTPGSPWPPEVPDEEACNGDDYQHSKMSGESAKYSPQHSDYYYDYNRNDPDRENPFTEAFDYMMGEAVTGNWEERTKWIYESPDKGKTVYRYVSGRDPSTRERVIIDDGVSKDTLKYQEDKSLKDLRDYVLSLIHI